MEVDGGTSRTSKPFSNAMLPSLLCAKVDHASFNTWNALSEKDREDWPTIQACEKGEGVPSSIWNKLTGKEKIKLTKVEREKKAQNNGGLGSQYSANQQLSSLPSGTILVPMMPQNQAINTQSKVNNEMVGSGTRNNDQTTVTANASGQESNQVRAANFLQLVNGNCVVMNATFRLSSNVSDR
eukprot:12180305-Ditylum_brightwellii.AAC.1